MELPSFIGFCGSDIQLRSPLLALLLRNTLPNLIEAETVGMPKVVVCDS